ncbi:MAG: hypothetical protein IPM29_15255 [Planctomycetes bacterium]|nr:hypothetical protein [Planctomycetota bacterium]
MEGKRRIAMRRGRALTVARVREASGWAALVAGAKAAAVVAAAHGGLAALGGLQQALPVLLIGALLAARSVAGVRPVAAAAVLAAGLALDAAWSIGAVSAVPVGTAAQHALRVSLAGPSLLLALAALGAARVLARRPVPRVLPAARGGRRRSLGADASWRGTGTEG